MGNRPQEKPLTNRVAIITGAGQGIGLGIAEVLGKNGATVIIGELDEARGTQAAQNLKARGFDVAPFPLDVRNRASCQSLIDDVMRRHGRIDILVNNAGIFVGESAEKTTQQGWELQLGVMLTGSLICSQAVAEAAMIPQRRGVIVNIASIGGFGGWPMRLAYNTAKAGVISLTQGLATEWARFGIRVNAISPGVTRTEMIETMMQSGVSSLAKYNRRIPLGRLGEVAEIASAVLFLVSDRASFITGENLIVDGGWVPWSNPHGVGWPEEDWID